MFSGLKKNFSSFLHAVIVVLFCAGQSGAQPIRFSLPVDMRGIAGDTVTIPLHLDPNGKAVGSFDATVEFQNTLLTYTGFTVGPILPANDNWFVDATGNNASGIIAVGAFSFGRVRGFGTAVFLKFVVNTATAGGDTARLSLRRLAATDTNAVSLPVEGRAGKFTVKPIIAGRIRSAAEASLAGVILAGLPNPITTDENGYYRAVVEPGWSGTLIPKNSGYTFDPPSRQYANVTRDQFDHDYRSATIIINEPFAFPNPFNPNLEPLQIRFALQKAAPASVKILDGRGELVKEFFGVMVSRPEFVQTIQWDGRNGRGDEVSNGVYFYIIDAPENRRLIGKIGVAR